MSVTQEMGIQSVKLVCLHAEKNCETKKNINHRSGELM